MLYIKRSQVSTAVLQLQGLVPYKSPSRTDSKAANAGKLNLKNKTKIKLETRMTIETILWRRKNVLQMTGELNSSKQLPQQNDDRSNANLYTSYENDRKKTKNFSNLFLATLSVRYFD